MEKKLKILAFIPARGGSKGVPGKNIKKINGKSLIQRTFELAKMSPLIDKIILSTDDIAIAKHGESIGINIPFLRPKEFAKDNSPMIDAIIYTLDQLKKRDNYVPDAVISLQPTSPLRQIEHIEKAINIMLKKDIDSVCSVIPIPLELCPHYVMKVNNEGYMEYFLEEGKNIKRRQDVTPAYSREGTVYLAKTNIIYKYKDLYGKKCIPMIIDDTDSLSIDTQEDWIRAEKELKIREC